VALTERVTNDYDNWTQGGDLAWTLLNGNSKAKNTSDLTGTIYTSTIRKSFVLSHAAQQATLLVKGRRYLYPVSNAHPGSATTLVRLRDADSVWHTLYNQGSGNGSLLTFLSDLNIKPYLSKAGTYRLQFTAIVGACEDAGSTWRKGWVQFEDVSLMVRGVTDWWVYFDEDAGTTEEIVSGATFLEPAAVLELFNVVKTTAPVTKEERLIAGIDDNTVLIFETGAPDGYYETDDEDFGYSGMDKQFDEVQFESSAEAPHAVTVSVSTDSGLTWTPIGTVIAQRGKACSVFTCITAEKFRVRFRGLGFHLNSYTLYAYPKGKMAKEAV